MRMRHDITHGKSHSPTDAGRNTPRHTRGAEMEDMVYLLIITVAMACMTGMLALMAIIPGAVFA